VASSIHAKLTFSGLPVTMDLSIIIVNWNSKDYLRNCIASIFANTQGIEFEIVVIDAASFDGCDEMLRKCYPQVRFIQSDRNLGFAKANNAAFTISLGRNLLFLNPDTELASSAVKTMYEWLCRLPNVGAVGCKILNADRSVQTSCIKSFPTIMNQFLDSASLRALWPKSHVWGMAALFGTGTVPEEVEAISGACIMLKRSVFEQVGRFSQEYFMYAEDVDLCHKIRQAGYKNLYVPEATVIHFGGGSTQKVLSEFTEIMMRESNWRFLSKTRGKLYGLAYRSATLLCAIARIAVLLILLPGLIVRQGGESCRVSLRKWRAILAWSIGFDDRVRNHLENHQ
jgi:GT2 family glycosyltransferase